MRRAGKEALSMRPFLRQAPLDANAGVSHKRHIHC
jgi:hypothetical protein